MSAASNFDRAKMNGRPGCVNCDGKGVYAYDHNHSTICNLCCRHDQGWWLLKDHYGRDNGKWCCKGGCGTVRDDNPGEAA